MRGFEWLGAIVLMVLTGCREGRQDSDTELPPLPELSLSAFEPAVREQISIAREALAATPTSADANGRLGMLLHAYGWLEKAEACYLRATVLGPADFRWWYLLGRLYADSGRTQEALGSFERAASRDPESLPALLWIGRLCLRREDVEGAQRWFARALEAHPRSPHALAGLAEVACKEGKLESAIERFKQAVALAPSFGRAHYGLALAYRDSGDAARAEDALERYAGADRNLEPPDPLADELQALRHDMDHAFRTANQQFKRGEYEEALRLYREAQRRNPEFHMVEYNIGLTLQCMDRPTEAIPHYERFLERRPDNLDAHNNLGLCAMSLKQHARAVAAFTKALELDSGYYKAHYNLGLLAAARRDLGQALDHFRRVIALQPRHEDAHFNLARLYKARGRKEDAVRHFLRVLELRPRDERVFDELLGAPSSRDGTAYRKLAGLLQRNGLSEAAAHALRTGLSAGDDWRTAVALAWILATCPDEKVRDPRQALSLVEPVCRGVAARDPTARDTLAAAYAALGRFADARSQAELALELARQQQTSPSADRLAQRIEFRLELYRRGKPFHER